jgi:hypothetical protein
VSKIEMNEWLSVQHGIDKCVPAFSGGTILLGSSREGENKQERSVSRRVYEEMGGKE